MRKPANQIPLTESQYQLVAARERHRPLTLKERRAADELIRTSPAAAKYAEALRGRLKEVATERLQVILGGTGSERASAAPAKGRKAALKILFADGLNTVTAGPPNLEFDQLRLMLTAGGRKRLGREVEVAPLDYSNQLGARRDAVAASDLLVIDATAFLMYKGKHNDRFAAQSRAINTLYEVAWAMYLRRRTVWFFPVSYDQGRNGRGEVHDVLLSLATSNSLPIFKMSGPSPESRFMPQDYRRLFEVIEAPFVVGIEAALNQILQAARDIDSSGGNGKERAVEQVQKSMRRRSG
jgi:hypothetical protein